MSQLLVADESGNGSTELPLVVAVVAVQTESEVGLRNSLVELRQAILEDPAFEGHKSRSSLVKRGFHRTDDLPDIQSKFLEKLQSEVGFRAYLAYAARADRAGVADEELLPRLYGKLMRTVMPTNFRTTERVAIESGDTIAERALKTAITSWASRDRHGTKPVVEVPTKLEEPLLGIADYFAGLIAACLQKDPSTFSARDLEHRQLARVLPEIALITDLKGKKVFNRSNIDHFIGSW